MRREANKDDVRRFVKKYKHKCQRRYHPWCDKYGIDLQSMMDAVHAHDDGKSVKSNASPTKRCFTIGAISKQWEAQEKKCACCCKKIGFNAAVGDHIIPHSRGGPTLLWNLQVLCGPCNQKKCSRDPMLWAFENNVSFTNEFNRNYYKGAVDKRGEERRWKF